LARYSGQLTARQASSSAALLFGSILLQDEYCKSHKDRQVCILHAARVNSQFNHAHLLVEREIMIRST
jgi:hypothetical protein